jgi:hypothetical protein
MSGLSDFSAKNLLNYICGQTPMPALPGGTLPTYASGNFTNFGVWLALMTAVDTDAGTGGTEVSGTGYARTQVAGAVAATASFSTASPNITMTTKPAWITNPAGMNVFDLTTMTQIGTVSTWSGTALVLTGNAAANSSGTTDNLAFSSFSPATASAPSQITNAGIVAFPQAGAGGWGTVIAFELRDAVTSGNLLAWDYIGNFSWLPATVSAASPGVITAHAHGYANGDPFVFSTEYGGTAPTFSAGNYTGVQTAAGVATDSLQVTGVNTSATGNGMIRKIVQQSIPANVTASFAASTLTATAA